MIYICFIPNQKGIKRKWWQKIAVKKEFTHIIILLKTDFDMVVLDYRWCGTIFDYYVNPAREVVEEYMKISTAVFTAHQPFSKLTNQEKKKTHFYFNLNCITLAKSILCISKPLIFTPYQLYKYLISNNFICIKKWDSQQ